ncbi:hypothetical protein HS5_02560 [Acidianus sp. HS-5]|nr:hypothetical protein HS5_02560 [Acidianus sp. HS-5]
MRKSIKIVIISNSSLFINDILSLLPTKSFENMNRKRESDTCELEYYVGSYEDTIR